MNPEHQHLLSVIRFVDNLLGVPVVGDNVVSPLVNGEAAYPEMLEAINGAEASVALSTYMFACDQAGLLFVEAIAGAISREVEVKVIVDSFGAILSWPPIQRSLKQHKINYASFRPFWNPFQIGSRYHRKMLIVDGTVGFTGGMNIRQHHRVNEFSSCPTADMQFKIEGPIVAEMRATFAGDWQMATGEVLSGVHWFPRLKSVGTTSARAIPSGPERAGTSRALILSALRCAKYEVLVVTPYFFPDCALVRALKQACQRGARVEIMVPRDTWFPFRWAFTPVLIELLGSGCRVLLTAPPFDHSKIFIVDSAWAYVGSSNWDSRSFFANYEFDVEVYCADLAHSLKAIVNEKRASAEELQSQNLESRGAIEKFRDSLAHCTFPLL